MTANTDHANDILNQVIKEVTATLPIIELTLNDVLLTKPNYNYLIRPLGIMKVGEIDEREGPLARIINKDLAHIFLADIGKHLNGTDRWNLSQVGRLSDAIMRANFPWNINIEWTVAPSSYNICFGCEIPDKLPLITVGSMHLTPCAEATIAVHGASAFFGGTWHNKYVWRCLLAARTKSLLNSIKVLEFS